MCPKEIDYELAEKRFNENKSVVPYVYNRWFSKLTAYQEDLFQEGYGALWKACCEFMDIGKVQLSTYMINSVYYKMLCYYKRVIYKHSHVMSLDSTLVAETTEGDSLYLIDTISKDEDPEAKYLIEICMSKLKPLDKKIINDLCVGFSEQEVADRYGVSQATISRKLIYFRKLIIEEKNK
jgi:RNA polymerase sigma factor (sigma-70 family)